MDKLKKISTALRNRCMAASKNGSLSGINITESEALYIARVLDEMRCEPNDFDVMTKLCEYGKTDVRMCPSVVSTVPVEGGCHLTFMIPNDCGSDLENTRTVGFAEDGKRWMAAAYIINLDEYEKQKLALRKLLN